MTIAQPPPSDLVLCAHYVPPTVLPSHLPVVDWEQKKENRWKSDDQLIGIRSIHPPDDLPALMDNLENLQRIKIIDVPEEIVIDLLSVLATSQMNNLQQLEIDCLRLQKDTSITFAFVALEFLSIDMIFVISDESEEQPEELGYIPILFDTPVLRKVYLGK